MKKICFTSIFIVVVALLNATNCEITCPNTQYISCSISNTPAFLNYSDFSNSGGSVSNDCEFMESSFILLGELSDGALCPEIITRTYRILDVSGNSYQCDHQIVVNDESSPNFTCPPLIIDECDVSGIEPKYNSLVEFLNAGGASFDNCGIASNSFVLISEVSDLQHCPETITRTYEISDLCSNVSQCDHILIIDDTQPPVIVPGTDQISEYEGYEIEEDPYYLSWLDNFAGVFTYDVCSSPILTHDGGVILDFGPFTISTVTFTAIDDCGYTVDYTHTYEIHDTQSPDIFCPSDITVSCLSTDKDAYVELSDFTNAGGTAWDLSGVDSETFSLMKEDTAGQVILRTYSILDNNTLRGSCTQKIYNCFTQSTLHISECESYTSPSGNYTWTTSGTYLDTIPNSFCTDSLITILLTIEDNMVEEAEDGMPNSLRTNLACAEFLDEINISPSIDTIRLVGPLVIDENIIIRGATASSPVLLFDFLNEELLNATYGMKVGNGKTVTLENVEISQKNNTNNVNLLLNEGELKISETVKLKID